MNYKFCIGISALCIFLLSSCSYDDTLEVLNARVQLEFPANSIESLEGLRVELTDMHASVFVDSTDASGIAQFRVPPGVYQVVSSGTKTTYDYRYIYNGTKGQTVISPDSTNMIPITMTVTKKRVVH